MAVKHLMKDSSGHLVRNSTGGANHPINDCPSSPPPPPTNPCVVCPVLDGAGNPVHGSDCTDGDCYPARYLVTFFGVAIPAGCFNCAPGTGANDISRNLATFTGSYCAAIDPVFLGPWFLTVASNILNVWTTDNLSCGTAIARAENTVINLNRVGGVFELWAYTTGTGGGYNHFYGTLTRGPCGGTFRVDNILTGANCVSATPYGQTDYASGGYAILSACGC